MRINKFLAACGVTSRRNADVLVQEGRVTVNGEVVEKPGFSVDEESDDVRVDGRRITLKTTFTYILLNKPAGFITSLKDPFERRTIRDLIANVPQRVYPVGRLDRDTEGVLLCTDDGELAFRLTHPRHEVRKVYHATVTGVVDPKTLEHLTRGVELPDGAIGKAREVSVINTEAGTSEVELVLTEGRKREVKHLCAAIGHPVISLVRVEFAGLKAGSLPIGQWRELSTDEVASVKALVNLTGNQSD